MRTSYYFNASMIGLNLDLDSILLAMHVLSSTHTQITSLMNSMRNPTNTKLTVSSRKTLLSTQMSCLRFTIVNELPMAMWCGQHATNEIILISSQDSLIYSSNNVPSERSTTLQLRFAFDSNGSPSAWSSPIPVSNDSAHTADLIIPSSWAEVYIYIYVCMYIYIYVYIIIHIYIYNYKYL
jgi:hypothetical protein